MIADFGLAKNPQSEIRNRPDQNFLDLAYEIPQGIYPPYDGITHAVAGQ